MALCLVQIQGMKKLMPGRIFRHTNDVLSAYQFVDAAQTAEDM